MFEEKYKGKTREEIDQTIKALQSQYSSMPPEAQKQAEEEIAYLEGLSKELVAKENIDNPPKKPEEPRAQGLLQSVKSAEKASAGITPPPKEEPNTEGKTFGVLDQKKYESKVAKEERKEAEKATRKEIQKQITSANDDSTNSGEFDIGEKTEITTPETTTPEDDNSSGGNGKTTPPQKNNGRYKSSMYGILDAMRNGDIDKSTGIYFMLDALSKAARNTGIDIGNIGAQFTGGTVRNDYQDSLWNQRKNRMFENEISSELNKQEGTDKEMEYSLAKEDLIGKGLSNEQADLALNASRTFNEKAEQFRAAGNDTMADLYTLVGSAATREVGPEELAAIAASGVLNTPEGKAAADEIMKMFKNLGGAIGGTFGGINQIISFFTGNK